jgi:hypothetical protein
VEEPVERLRRRRWAETERFSVKHATDGDGRWISPKLRRSVLVRMRDRSDAVDRLVKHQVQERDDMTTEERWAMYCQQVRLAASRAELEAWRHILDTLPKGA